MGVWTDAAAAVAEDDDDSSRFSWLSSLTGGDVRTTDLRAVCLVRAIGGLISEENDRTEVQIWL